ncbi:uncharacterized protein A4U43_C07F27530 [Asparagus officinalis]|uniref:Uncharacterized protein n=1 Tax=Asparagus officinalis TaxID=4686 RepID=A0A5P1EFC4_ASPOF|nr:uncharacterized protein A4U43_C07F27530 [Asparagus officinalis]
MRNQANPTLDHANPTCGYRITSILQPPRTTARSVRVLPPCERRRLPASSLLSLLVCTGPPGDEENMASTYDTRPRGSAPQEPEPRLASRCLLHAPDQTGTYNAARLSQTRPLSPKLRSSLLFPDAQLTPLALSAARLSGITTR